MIKQWIIGLVMMIAMAFALVFIHEIGHFLFYRLICPNHEVWISFCEKGLSTSAWYNPPFVRFFTKLGGLLATLSSLILCKTGNLVYIGVTVWVNLFGFIEVIFL